MLPPMVAAQIGPTGATVPVEHTETPAGHAETKVGITSARFLASLVAQFLGTANDSAFTILLLLLLITGDTRQGSYSLIATALLAIAFLLFSPVAGYLADRFPKHRVLLWTTAPEIGAMALATIGLYLHSIPLLVLVLLFIAARSAFLLPAMYGILPEIFVDADISAANGILELIMDLAILAGSMMGMYLYSLFASNLTRAGLVFVGIAGLGTIAILSVPRTLYGNRETRFAWNVFSSFSSDLAHVRRSSTLYYTLVGMAWFGFLAAFFLVAIPDFGRNVPSLGQTRSSLLLAPLLIGTGIGSVVAGRVSRKHVEIGLVPLGSVGITIFSFLLVHSGAGRTIAILGLPLDTTLDLMLLGFCGGFFIIPLRAMLQQRAPLGMKGRLVAFANVLTFSAVLLAAAMAWLLTGPFGLDIREVILFVAMLTLAGTVYVVRMLPDFMVRLILWSFANTFYRIRTFGDDNLPKEGALLVANHVSFVDPIIVGASTSRIVRFLVFRPYYELKYLNWFFRIMHAIPVSADDGPQKLEASLQLARSEIQQGHTVCIFAEGAVTRTGNLLKFRRGLERIASAVNAPIVPIYLDGVWGSIFSFDRGRFLFKRPRRLLEPVNVVFGRPMPSDSKADEVRRAIQELSVETFNYRKALQKPLHLAFIRRAKRRWHATLAVDADGSTIGFGTALVRAIALSRALWNRGDAIGARVGILMPPGIDAMLANFATLIAGHIPVNIDAVDVSHSVVSRAQLTRVVTTREFARVLDAAGKLSPATVSYFEDAEAATGTTQLNRIRVLCKLMPMRFVARLFVCGSPADVDQVATILFSYRADASDPPRGAMLTHHNLLSNLESLRQIFHVTHRDCILGLIPFSNSMSFAATLLLPALTGASVAFAAELLGQPALGAFCRANRITLIPASPAMLESILDGVDAADLPDLRHVAVGGELDDAVRESFLHKFGTEPLDGYGCPECAPIISLNIPDYGKGANRQLGMRQGTAGQPLPGVSVRIVDPTTGLPVAQGVEGALLVSGPNLMKGYLEGSEVTNEVMHDGWYVTGDRARVDSDGFLTIARRQTLAPQA